MKTETKLFLLNAEDCLLDAQVLLSQNRTKGTVSRAYYAVFDANQALIFEIGEFNKTHSGAHNRFHQHFIRTNIFPAEMGSQLEDLFEKSTVRRL